VKGRSGSLEHAGTSGFAALSAAAAGSAARPTFDEGGELGSRHRRGDLEGSAAASSAAAATAPVEPLPPAPPRTEMVRCRSPFPRSRR